MSSIDHLLRSNHGSEDEGAPRTEEYLNESPIETDNMAESHTGSYETNAANMQERHPDWPKLDVSFWFTAHERSQDMEGIESQIAAADVYFYENSVPGLTKALQGISMAPGSPLEDIIKEGIIYDAPIKGSHWEPVIRGLYGSQVIVGSFDLRPDEQEIRDEILESAYRALPREGSFLDALELFRDNTARTATAQNKREQLMLRHFEEDVEATLQSYPDLKEKDNLKIIISIGSYHTTLRHLFAREGIKSKEYFPNSVNGHYVYSYENELQRTLALEKEPTTELLQRAFIERFIAQAVDASLKDAGVAQISYELKAPFIRKLTGLLNEREMKRMYDLFQKRELTLEGIRAALAEEGIDDLTQSAVELAA